MRLSRRRFAAMLPTLAMAGARPADAADAALQAAIASPTRSPKNTVRDRYRHPYRTLKFFGLRDDLAVLEIEPGAGYWTEILAPYLKAHGRYSVAVPPAPPGNAREAAARAAYLARLQAHKAAYGAVQVFNLAPPAPLGLPDAQDLVLSFRNLHDWMAEGTAPATLSEIHAALKPGGIFGIEDHRGLTTTPQDPRAKSGYVREDYARALIGQAGFKFVAESSVGDNPRDTKHYAKGVWTLPPSLVLGPVDRAKYLAIGESDRWTMKFTK